MIFHVTTKTDWLMYEAETYYAPQAFKSEGFIHACLPHQLDAVLERHFHGQEDLLLLHINEKKLNTAVFMEGASADAEQFPHIYGVIDKHAIEKIEQIPERL